MPKKDSKIKQQKEIDQQIKSWQESVVKGIHVLRAANSTLIELLHDKGILTGEEVKALPERVEFFYAEIIEEGFKANKTMLEKLIEKGNERRAAEEAVKAKRLSE